MPATEADNRRLIAAFDMRDTLEARTAAWPLVGGAARWEQEVLAEGVPPDALIFRGEQPKGRRKAEATGVWNSSR